MGKYVSVKMPKYTALVYPQDAANAVVDAWKRAVTEFGQEMRNNYVMNIVEAATDPEKIRKMEQGLTKFYDTKLLPKKPELKAAMAPIRQQYKMEAVEELRRRGAAPAPAIMTKR